MNKIGQISTAPARSSQQGTSQKSSVPVRLSAAQEASALAKAETSTQVASSSQPVDTIQINALSGRHEFPSLEVVTRQLLTAMHEAMDKALRAAEEEALVAEQLAAKQQAEEQPQTQPTDAVANTQILQAEGYTSTAVVVSNNEQPVPTPVAGSTQSFQFQPNSVTVPQPTGYTAPVKSGTAGSPVLTPLGAGAGSGQPAAPVMGTTTTKGTPTGGTGAQITPSIKSGQSAVRVQAGNEVAAGQARQPQQTVKNTAATNSAVVLGASQNGLPLLRSAVGSIKQSTPAQLQQTHVFSRSDILKA